MERREFLKKTGMSTAVVISGTNSISAINNKAQLTKGIINSYTHLIPGMRELILNQKNRFCLIERERILNRVVAQELESIDPSEHYVYAFCKLMEEVSTPIAEYDVILGRGVEGLPDIPEEELTKIIDRPYGWRDLLVNFIIGSPGHMTLNYNTLITKGLSGIVTEANETAQKLKTNEAIRFAANARICSDAIRDYAKRYSNEAKQKAAITDDPFLKNNYLRASRALEVVPYSPAYDYFSSLQSIWIMQFINSCYVGARDIGFGRLDQCLLPFYLKDKNTKQFDYSTAVGITAHFLMKANEIVGTQGTHYKSQPMPSSGSKQYIILGGISKEGKPLNNEVSNIILDAASILKLTQPNIIVRLTPNYPHEFFEKATATALKTQGVVQFYNDNVIVPGFINAGVSEDDAFDYTANGCSRIEIGACNVGNEHYFNTVSWLMWMLNDTDTPLFKQKKYRMVSGETLNFELIQQAIDHEWRPNAIKASEYKNMDEIIEQFGKLTDVILRVFSELTDHISEPLYQHHKPFKQSSHFHLESLLMDDCVKKGLSYCEGGQRYNVYTLWLSGIATIVDSLVTIKTVVFDTKQLTLLQLMEICNNNFEGEEYFRQFILNSIPKFGNDVTEVDSLAASISNRLMISVERCRRNRTSIYLGGFYSLHNEIGFGKQIQATPDGRIKGAPVSENQSPTYGADRKGPTALLNSISKLPFTKACTGGCNIRFHNKVQPDKITALIKTYFKSGGLHLGITSVDRNMLIDATIHPDKHKTLIIRQYGFSEYFIAIQPDEQMAIINRTEHSL